MDSQKQQVSERIKQANNILITVSSNPSVDQLSACIGLTLALNKMGKHATAVFSGAVPSTIEFLQPEKTIEKNTDSLRDFIIALDKSKADKLRYKVEDKVVKIFITPYRTSISDRDLEFSQGDFNVDVVVALGVRDQADLDQAITAHGRILHDATVMSVNVRPGGELGGINWVDPAASSLAELATQLVDALDKKLVDNQIATALLTGIVAETDRFSNAKTSPQTMSISAELMAAGANQQLVATKLEEPVAPPPMPEAMPIKSAQKYEDDHKPDDGTLEITHENARNKPDEAKPSPEPPKEESEESPEPEPPQIHIDEHGSLSSLEDKSKPKPPQPPIEDKPWRTTSDKPSHTEHNEGPHLVLQPPTFDSQMTAAATPTGFPSEDAMSLPQVEPNEPLLDREPLQTQSVGPTITPPSEQNGQRRDTDNSFPSNLPELSDLPSLPDENPPEHNPTLTPMPEPPMPPIMSEPPTIPSPSAVDAIAPSATLSDIERGVHSTHLDPPVAAPISVTPPMPPAPATPSPSSSFAIPEPTFSSPAPSFGGASPGMPTTTLDSVGSMVNSGTSELDTPAGAPNQSGADTHLNNARDAVDQAINGATQPVEPIQALNAQALGGPLHNSGIQPPAVSTGNPLNNLPTAGSAPTMPAPPEPSLPGVSNVSFSPADNSVPNLPSSSFGMPPAMPGSAANGAAPTFPSVDQGSAGAPPPVPPPMLPPLQP